MDTKLTKHVENETAQQRLRHPSRNLEPRSRGYGIGGGYERPYRKATPVNRPGRYAALPHSGYYGAGSSARRFDLGQAGFNDEVSWYAPQYGEITSK